MELKLSKKKLIGSFIIVIIFIIVILSKVNKEPEEIFLTEVVKKGNVEEVVTATGSIRSNNRVEVGAQVDGKIMELNVVLGQKVKKGELLARIDSTTQENDLEKAKSILLSYEANLESKEIETDIKLSQFKRAGELYKLKSISQEEYEEAKQSYYLAKSELEGIKENIKQAQIDVKTAETELSYTTITSPIDGVVISIPVSVGQTVNSKQSTPTIIQVADLTKMLIKPEISEGDITKLKVGQEVEFSILSAPERIFKGKIDSIDPANTTLTDDEYTESISNTEAIYYYANVVVDNDDEILRIGMTTTSNIKIAEAKNVILVPTTAIRKKNGKNYVNILTSEKKVIEREVELGINDDLNTEIKSGLSEGDEIVLNQIKSGEMVGKAPRRF